MGKLPKFGPQLAIHPRLYSCFYCCVTNEGRLSRLKPHMLMSYTLCGLQVQPTASHAWQQDVFKSRFHLEALEQRSASEVFLLGRIQFPMDTGLRSVSFWAVSQGHSCSSRLCAFLAAAPPPPSSLLPKSIPFMLRI